MKFITPEADMQLYADDGYGPFCKASHDRLLAAYQNRKALPFPASIDLDTIVPSVAFVPKVYLVSLPGVVIFRKGFLAESTTKILKSAIISTACVNGECDYMIFDLDAVEEIFCKMICFPRSNFNLIKGVSLYRKGGAHITSKMQSVGSRIELEKCRIRIFPLDRFLCSDLVTKADWDSEIFAFDSMLYVSESLDLTETGLVPLDNLCRLRVE